MKGGNFERECIEERCSDEELLETTNPGLVQKFRWLLVGNSTPRKSAGFCYSDPFNPIPEPPRVKKWLKKSYSFDQRT